MPRFVAKEDVVKGLVDPTKPLKQQPLYQKKIQEQQQNKQTKEEPEKLEQRQKKPKRQGEEPEKFEQKQKKPKRQRDDRPQFNWNRKQITLETKVPETPKLILQKPDNQKFKAELNSLKQLKDNLYQQRKKLIDEQNFLIKSNSENKKGGFAALSKYGLELKEKNNLKKSLFDKVKKLEDERNTIESQLKALKDQNGALIKPQELQQVSSQELKHRIANLQQRLSSANLSKKEEAQINNKINLTKRALIKARSDIEISTEISKNEDKIKILTEDSRALRKQIDAKYNELKPLKTEIDQLQKKKKEEEGTITEVKSVDDVRAQYDRKIKEVEAKRDEAHKKMDQLRNNFNKSFDAFEDQQDLLRYIKYVQEEIDYKRKRKEEENRYLKEKQERELKKKKEFDQREKKREEWKKQQEERKKRDEERKQKLQSEKEAFLNRNPNWQTIDMCEFMIKYCENIRPDAHQTRANEERAKAQNINLQQQKGWEKQVKSGCEVIVSKKTKLDEEATKKVKKEKKNKPEQNDDSFSHSIDTINRFHDLSILPPANAGEIDQTIKQLQQKIQILSKPSQEAVEAFKVKAAKEFDRLHGFSEDNDKEHTEEQRPVRAQDKKKERSGKIDLKGADFPELN